MRERWAAGEQVARLYREPGLAWLERQAEVMEDLDVLPRVHDHAQPRPSTQNSFPSGSASTVHGTSP
jgi:hypothetical protein